MGARRREMWEDGLLRDLGHEAAIGALLESVRSTE